ncbi:MAG: hypothetical protein Q9219_000622 [cf. Caloplaca sp. 3 TL-2023]
MSDYAPPSGPPPPKVPEGWKAQWNDQYHEWFYVNLHTKISQWDRPTSPAHPPSDLPPPSYTNPLHNNTTTTYPEKHSYNPHPPSQTDSDAAFAARLQAEEDERARLATASGRPTSRGAADSYYSQQGHGGGPQPPGLTGGYPGAPPSSSGYDANELPPRTEGRSKGGLGGLLSKLSGKSSGAGHQGHYPPQPAQGGYGGGGYPPQQGYPPYQQGYGGGGGGYPPQHGYGYGAPPHKRHGGGMGAGGAAALGLGGGLLGGALLADSLGGDDGGGDYGGGDYGGGDDGGGGDFGGGDFGGGDGGGGGD